MVRIGTILTLAAIGIAIAGFIGLGGASGIGQRVGSGLSKGFADFTSAFQSSLTSNIFGGSSGQNVTAPPSNLTGQPIPIGLPNLINSFNQTNAGLQGVNNFLANLFSGASFNPFAQQTSLLFTPTAISQRISFQSRNKGIVRTNFGGFGSAIAQESALQQAITESQRDNPSFFLKGQP